MRPTRLQGRLRSVTPRRGGVHAEGIRGRHAPLRPLPAMASVSPHSRFEDEDESEERRERPGVGVRPRTVPRRPETFRRRDGRVGRDGCVFRRASSRGRGVRTGRRGSARRARRRRASLARRASRDGVVPRRRVRWPATTRATATATTMGSTTRPKMSARSRGGTATVRGRAPVRRDERRARPPGVPAAAADVPRHGMERPEEPDVRRDQTEDHDANSDGGATPRRGGGEGRGGGDGPGRREAPEGCPESISGCPTPRNPVPGRTHARVFQPVLVLRRVDGPVARRTLGRSTRDASFRNRGGCPRVGNPSKPIRSRAAGGRARARDGALRRHGLRRRARDGLRRGGRQSSRVFRGTLRGRRRRKRKTRGRCGCGVATRGRARGLESEWPAPRAEGSEWRRLAAGVSGVGGFRAEDGDSGDFRDGDVLAANLAKPSQQNHWCASPYYDARMFLFDGRAAAPDERQRPATEHALRFAAAKRRVARVKARVAREERSKNEGTVGRPANEDRGLRGDGVMRTSGTDAGDDGTSGTRDGDAFLATSGAPRGLGFARAARFKLPPAEAATRGHNHRQKRTITHVFHPVYPFAMSISQAFMQPQVVSFHVRWER